MVVTNQPIQISYFVADITTALDTYNRLRWWRSRSGKDGLYEAATAAAAAAAVLDSSVDTPHQLNAKELKFRVNGVTEVDVTFSDPDPVTTAQVVVAINGATGLVVASDVDGKLRLTTVATGSNASIEILDGDANPFLGFAEGDGAVGIDADTALVSGTHEYFWTDQNSDTDFWYKVEFLHATTGDTTGTGVPFPPPRTQTIAKSLTIVAFIRLADLSGNPIPNRRVTLNNVFMPSLVQDQSMNWGVFRHNTQISTDRDGYAEVRILRGVTIDMSIDGTGFVRRILIPSTGDSVDLLDTSLVVDDEFGIQEPNIDFAVRTS